MTGFFIVAAVVIILFLAAVALLGAARRRDASSAVGSLTRETVKRDRSARGTRRPPRSTPSRRPAARSSAPRRSSARGGEIEKVGEPTPAAWTPPDIETYDVNRRQFLNRSVVALMGLGISAFGVAIVGLPVAVGLGRASARRSTSARSPTSRPRSRRPTASSTGPRAACGSPSTRRTALPKAERRVLAARADRHEGRPGRAVPEVPAPRVPCSELQQLAVVRVSLPRLAVQPGR